jgi:hypothetical protein
VVQVSSTETGVILGSLVYDVAGSGDTNYIALNDIHIDILDYITPAHCTHPDFRAMWAEFEWENKVVVNTNFTCAPPPPPQANTTVLHRSVLTRVHSVCVCVSCIALPAET